MDAFDSPAAARRSCRVKLAALLLFFVVAALTACGGGSDPEPEPDEAHATIGAAGGTLDGPDGSRVIIPAGALARDTVIGIARRATGAPEVLPDGVERTGATYEFTPHDIAFAQAVTIRVPASASTTPATVADVYRASPGEPWSALGVSAAGGFAEWRSATFSWYTPTTCVIPAGNADPYPCTGIVGNTVLVATPSTAIALQWSAQGQSNYRVREAAVLQLTTTFNAPPDCGDARVDFKRHRASDTQNVLLASVIPAVSTTPSGRVQGSASFSVALTEADNGETVLFARASCRRAYQSPSHASRPLEQQRIGGFNAFVLDTLIPTAPATTAPAVTQQPAAQRVVEPATATFSAQASGSPAPDVQWQFSLDGVVWTDLSGATGTTYTTPPTSVADSGKRYRAVFSNASGTATTDAAMLTVDSGGGAAIDVYFWTFNTDRAETTAPGVGEEGEVRDANTGALLDDPTLAHLRTDVQGFAGLGPVGAGFDQLMLRLPTGTQFILELNGLPSHQSLSLQFLLAAIDSLDGTGSFPAGDFMRIEIDGVTVFRESFENSGAAGPQSYVPAPGATLARKADLGFSGPGGPFTDSAYDMSLEPRLQRIPHTGSRVRIVISFEGPGQQPLDDESWGIDNLRVQLH